MNRLVHSITPVLLFPLWVFAQTPPTIKLPPELKVDRGRQIIIKAETTGKAVVWINTDPLNADLTTRGGDGKEVVFSAPETGLYRLYAYTAAGDVPSQPAACMVRVIGVNPPGPHPPDPGPNPPPNPPTPTPPITEPGFRVLIVYESADLSKLPPSQQNVLYGATVRDYLTSHCKVGPDGKTIEWRIWDKDVATDKESKLWQEVMKRPRTALPWIVISNGVTGYEGPLPVNVEDTLALLKKYGGQ